MEFLTGDDQSELLNPSNHIGRGEGLPGPGHLQKNMVFGDFQNSITQFFDGLRLIALGLELGNQFETIHKPILKFYFSSFTNLAPILKAFSHSIGKTSARTFAFWAGS